MRTPTEVIDMLARSFERAVIRFIKWLGLFIREDRRAKVMLRAIAKFIAVIVTIFVLRHEFPELFGDMGFILLLAVWAGYGLLILIEDLQEAKEKTTSEKISEKIDELISEIRQDRNERNSKLK